MQAGQPQRDCPYNIIAMNVNIPTGVLLFDIPFQFHLYLKIMFNRNLILVKALLLTAWHFKAVAEGGFC